MKFKAYIKSFDTGQRRVELRRLAKLLRLSEHTMLSYYRGYRRLPVETVADLQRITGQRVLLADEFPQLAERFISRAESDDEADA